TTVSRSHKIALFSQIQFIVSLVSTSILFQITWFFACLVLARPEDEQEIRLYQSMFREEYERETNEGCFIMNYWREGSLSIRPFLLAVIADGVEIVSFFVAASLAVLTYQEIVKAQHISETIRAFQLRILLAASAQTLTPVLFVYSPYFVNVTISLVHIYSPTFLALSMVLLSCFPCIDAVVIIVLMRSYRDGLLRLLGRKDVQRIVGAAPSSTITTS
ncbi:hypothetical protein PENTCL1PPCAC_15582, partial [Pristionchus entomophagus]